jgi:hypothetical protein
MGAFESPYFSCATSGNISASACSNTAYFFNGNNINVAGTYHHLLVNKLGCDSLVTLNLTLKNISDTSLNIARCTSSYEYNGATYNSSGNYRVIYINKEGCDSIVELHLTFQYPHSTIHHSIMSGQTYSVGDSVYSTSCIFTTRFKTKNGCDSIITLYLIVGNKCASSSTQTATICKGQGYSFVGHSITTSGTYTFHTLNKVGCDSTATLNITVLKPASTINAGACSGQTYTYNGTSYGLGQYKVHFTSKAGCDSVVTLNVKYIRNSSSRLPVFFCPGGSYTYYGNTYIAAGSYVVHLKNIAGCDSSVTVGVNIKKTSYSTTYIKICKGGSYTFTSPKAITEAGSDGVLTLPTVPALFGGNPPRIGKPFTLLFFSAL